MNQEQMLLLCDVFNQLNLQERKAEALRLQLCRQKTFNPYAGFKSIEHHNEITINDLDAYLQKNGYNQSSRNLFELFHKDSLSYQDYLQIILPRSDPLLREQIALLSPQICPIEHQFVVQLFILEIQEYDQLERLKQRLTHIPTEVLFESVDINRNGGITYSDLDRFFRKNGLLMYEDELQRVFLRLNSSGIIMLNDFKDFFPNQISRMSSTKVGQIVSSMSSMKKDSQHKSEYRQHSQSSNFKQKTISVKQDTQQSSSTILETDMTENQLYLQYLSSKDHQFVSLLLEMLRMELRHEEIKMELYRQPDYNAMDAFHFIDQGSKGKASESDMSRFLKKIGVQKPNVQLIFHRLDHDGDGLIRFSDYNEFTSPLTNIPHKQPVNSDLSYTLSKLFSVQTIQLLNQFFTEWTNNETLLINRIAKMKINFNQVFSLIDVNKKGVFTKSEVSNIVIQFQSFMNQFCSEDVSVLFRRFSRGKKEVKFQNFLQRLM